MAGLDLPADGVDRDQHEQSRDFGGLESDLLSLLSLSLSLEDAPPLMFE